MPILSSAEILLRLEQKVLGPRAQYLAMYSSWAGGITLDPALMMVPVDDHLVHRGDGVFEAIKCVGNRVYALDPHLERLKRSAQRVGLELPFPVARIRELCLLTIEAALDGAAPRDVMIRLYVSRGPGGFTTNPYESVAAQMYLVITPFSPMSEVKYQNGVNVGLSEIPVKEGFFATIKSCNYLANVLMKKEAVDRGFDFTVGLDESGHLTESSTENFAIVSEHDELVVPEFDRTLRGITVVRVMELAEELVQTKKLRRIRLGRLDQAQVQRAKEAMMIGTTLDVLPVTEFAGHAVADGKVGPIARHLLLLIRQDLVSGPLALDWRSALKN